MTSGIWLPMKLQEIVFKSKDDGHRTIIILKGLTKLICRSSILIPAQPILRLS